MSSRAEDSKLLDVVGVRVEMPSSQPIVLLKESDGPRFLPIWVGAVEATAIAFAQQGVTPPRPLTHDLLKDVIAATGNNVREVFLSELRNGVFYAELVFDNGLKVSARPSDAIALALRTGTPIFGSTTLLAQAGIEINEGGESEANEGVPAGGEGSEFEVERFREFLDQIDPEDFAI
jgi:bifunctional DNase/RNase